MREAEEFWDWRSEEDSWERIRAAGLEHLESRLGPHTRSWAADGGEYPPRAVVLFQPPQHPDVAVYATLGMSAQPQPQVELYGEAV